MPPGNTAAPRVSASGQRIGKACLQCRARKRRCNGQMPSCSNCLDRELSCQYPTFQKRRGEGKSKQRIEVLEARLAQLESSLPASNVPPPEDLVNAVSEDNPPGPSTQTSGILLTAAVEVLSELRTSAAPPTPAHLTMPTQARIAELRPRVTSSFFRSMVGLPVNPKDMEVSLLHFCLGEYFKEFPYLDIDELRNRIATSSIATVEDCGGPSRWGCVCAAIALSVLAKAATGSFEVVSPFAWTYFKNAYGVVPELMLYGDDVQAVQAVVVMAEFASHSADGRTTALLLSTALRMAQALGLSRAGYGDGMGALQKELARRTLWAAFILDTELSLFCGLAPSLSGEDVEIDLPSESFDHDRENTSGASPAQIFRCRAQLALIQSRIRARLYSHHSFSMPDAELVASIASLEAALESWRHSLPTALQPGNADIEVEPHRVALHLAFHNATSMVHWAARRHSSMNSIPPGTFQKPALPEVQSSCRKVQAAARQTLFLLKGAHLEFTQFWRGLCFPLSTIMTLLIYLFEAPKESDTSPDMLLIKGFVRYVINVQRQGDSDLSNLLKACLWLDEVANGAVDIAKSRGRSGCARDGSLPGASSTDTIESIIILLSSSTHPMYLAKDLSSNIQTRDVEISRSVAYRFGLPLEGNGAYGPLAPTCMKPSTYGFNFERES